MNLSWLSLPADTPDHPQAPTWSFFACSVLALAAVWIPEFHAGIDLPQHANLFRLWLSLEDGPLEYQRLYRVNLFTPYLVPYALGVALTATFGAMTAVKCLLSFIALATPWFMARWLRAVGGTVAFGLFGFLLAFGYTYLWGLLSHSFAMPLLFGYLASFETHYQRPSAKGALLTTLWGSALFLSHGIAFGVGAGSAGLCWLLRKERWKRRQAAYHFIPLGLATIAWIAVGGGGGWTRDWLVTGVRIMELFSGPFYAEKHPGWAAVSVAILAVLAVVGRPRLVFTAARSVPLAYSVLLVLILPEWLSGTWLVGTRCIVFIHAFSPAAFEPRTDGLGRQLPRVTLGLVLAGLVLLNVRLHQFNEEARGLKDLIRAMPSGADVKTLVTRTDQESRVFGSVQFSQMPAWITATGGGLIENDSASYFQLPVQRLPVNFPKAYRYVVTRGSVAMGTAQVKRFAPGATHVQTFGEWQLYAFPELPSGAVSVVRYAQDWGQLQVDRAVTRRLLRAGRQRFEHGLGTHATSFIAVHVNEGGEKLNGHVGLNEDSKGQAKAVFRISDSDGSVLFESAELTSEDGTQAFSVPLKADRYLLLETIQVGSNRYAYTDWLDLTTAD